MSGDWQSDVLREIGVETDGLMSLPPGRRPSDPLQDSDSAGEPSEPDTPGVWPSLLMPGPIPPPPAPHGTSSAAAPAHEKPGDRDSAARNDNSPLRQSDPQPAPSQPYVALRQPSELDGALIRRPVHGDPILSRVVRGIRDAVGASVSREVDEWTAMVARLQQPVTTTRRIAVTSLRGGAGKTTIATLAASVLAQHRQDPVLLVDADPEFGSIRLRLGITSAPSLHELAGRQFESFEDARPFLARTGPGLWVLPGAAPGTDPELDLSTFEAVAAALYRFFAIVVFDCGAGLDRELQRSILATAHSHLHVAPATADGAVSAGRALDWLDTNGYHELTPHTVTVFAIHSPHGHTDLTPATELVRSNGIDVIPIAYDRHLASGGKIDPSLLAESTRFTAVKIAAEALSNALTLRGDYVHPSADSGPPTKRTR